MFHRTVFRLYHFVAVVCFFAALASAADASDVKPVAVVEAAYDFGMAFEGSDVTHDFIVKNTGNADLEIQSVKAG